MFVSNSIALPFPAPLKPQVTILRAVKHLTKRIPSPRLDPTVVVMVLRRISLPTEHNVLWTRNALAARIRFAADSTKRMVDHARTRSRRVRSFAGVTKTRPKFNSSGKCDRSCEGCVVVALVGALVLPREIFEIRRKKAWLPIFPRLWNCNFSVQPCDK